MITLPLLSDEDLFDYCGPVVYIDPPRLSRSIQTHCCLIGGYKNPKPPYSTSRPILTYRKYAYVDGACVWLGPLPFQARVGGLTFALWMGQCAECGKVYQTWLAL